MIVPANFRPEETDNGYVIRLENGMTRMPRGAHFFDGDWMDFPAGQRMNAPQNTPFEPNGSIKRPTSGRS